VPRTELPWSRVLTDMEGTADYATSPVADPAESSADADPGVPPTLPRQFLLNPHTGCLSPDQTGFVPAGSASQPSAAQEPASDAAPVQVTHTAAGVLPSTDVPV
jgi:hypothetical protein